MKLPCGDSLDAARRSQCLDLEAQVAVHVLFRRAVPLHTLDLVSVAEQLEVLPGREQDDQDEKCADAEGSPQLALARFVHLAHDRIVPDVLLDGVFEVQRAHASLSIARSFALRARGLRATSASAGVTGLRVSTRSAISPAASARKTCLTMRSSSEWNVITASRAPARSRRDASSRNVASPSSSRLTQMRSAWKVRVAGSIR